MKLSENNIGQIWQEHSNKHPPQLQSTDFPKKNTEYSGKGKNNIVVFRFTMA
jgi:hypothetical protein